jgi:ATP-dependent DNA helicase DinG
MEILMEEIKKIINATHGHTLILFTSYWLMERVFYGLKEEISGYPLFMMGKGRLDVISNFRKSGNGVLFASDSAGEGIDLAGDILSSLIVVKLPFPVPDPVMEYQSRQYDDFELYKQDIIIPGSSQGHMMSLRSMWQITTALHLRYGVSPPIPTRWP